MLERLKKIKLIITLATLLGILLAAAACNQDSKQPTDANPTSIATVTPKSGKELDGGDHAAANTANTAAGNKRSATTAAANQISIENFAFAPADLTVKVGAKVTWVNKDSAPHTATSTDQVFNSNALDTGDQFSFVFTDKGDYSYFCALHPQMRGQITVK